MDKSIDLNPIDDHNKAFSVSKEDLRKANERILEMSKNKKSNVEISGDKIIHKRSELDYETLWNFFLEHADAFSAYMGYGKEKIEKIGVKKFIDAMDWRNREDVSKYQTDKIKIVPCCHCDNEFAYFKIENMTLCKDCLLLYDMDKINKFIEDYSNKSIDPTNILLIFHIKPDVREKFLL